MTVNHDCSTCFYCKTRQMSVFCELTEEQVKELNIAKKIITIKKGDTAFEEGSRPKGLYCVSRGKLKLTQTGIEGKEQILRLAAVGDVIGYRALLGQDTYACTAVAIEETNLCFIPLNVFLSFIEKNSRLSLRLFQLFSEDLKDAERQVTDLAQRPVKERVAQALLLLKGTYGLEDDFHTINVSVTREEIAAISGTTRETATRLLSELDKEEVIRLNGKKIIIENERKLLRAANVPD